MVDPPFGGSIPEVAPALKPQERGYFVTGILIGLPGFWMGSSRGEQPLSPRTEDRRQAVRMSD
jgi:hypothetical protein